MKNLKSLISENLRIALCEKYAGEILNAQNYIYIAAFLKNKGLDKLAGIFEGQHAEEISHSKLIYEFLTDMNAAFEVYEGEGVNFPINTIMDIAEKYLEREEITTENLNDIKQLCIEERNGVAEEFLRQMVNRQRSELAETSNFYDNAELCSGDWYRVKVWNDTLGCD